MSSFFTTPASQRKRRRIDAGHTPAAKKRITAGPKTSRPSQPARRPERDESISGSESDEEEGLRQGTDAEDAGTSESEDENETAAERRLRLAERYLENIREEVDEVGFDAEQIDKDLIAERLKEDVAESKGRLYRHIADDLAFSDATQAQFRADTLPTTAVATCAPYAYTTSKDVTLIKWELASPPSLHPQSTDDTSKSRKTTRRPHPARRRPKQVAFARGEQPGTGDTTIGHTSPILTVAASQDNKYVVTGGMDRRLIIWDATTLKPLKAFTQHRDSVISLSFRRGTNQLYSASKDRTIKIWSLDDLAYVETLFGHQDEVVDIAALAHERCVSVGARDRTARLWKVIEETQLVFRGGDTGTSKKSRRDPLPSSSSPQASFAEGSIDRVAMIDEETFITGSDNGSLSLWNIHKKKPIYILPLAHGRDPAPQPVDVSAEQHPPDGAGGEPQPRWITALVAVPYSDLVLSGSWDGHVRAWKVIKGNKNEGRRDALIPMGALGAPIERALTAPVEEGQTPAPVPTSDPAKLVRGIINDLSVFERGDRGQDGLCVVAAVGTEHRLGRWKKVGGKNGAVVFEVPRRTAVADGEDGDGSGKVAAAAG
ncbi:MAG: pre-rRNA processing protein [Caeruleum heppii]|nr:MAG: pre-rRNA processing protein [Caeruleum heppii]